MTFFDMKSRRVSLWLTFLLFLTGMVPVKAQKLASNGRLVGVVHNERNEILAGATVTVQPGGISHTTDISGNFEFDLSPKVYKVTVSYAGYRSVSSDSLKVRKGEVTRNDVVLLVGMDNSTEVVVTATTRKRESVASVLRIQKNAITVSDVLGAEQIKRTPDNNVAQALVRVNGVTILENKFVIIRGMGERYNTVLINGAQLPSTEANRKNFSFDLLPSSIVENIIVSKTASPDMPADFAGGIVQVNTKKVPDKVEGFLQIGAGANSNSTGLPFYSSRLTPSEYFTKLNSEKNWYGKTWSPIEYFKLRSSLNPADVERSYQMNAKIPNYWGYYNLGDARPTVDLQGGMAWRTRFKDNSSLGIMGSGTFRNEQLIEDFRRQTYFLDSVRGHKYSFVSSMTGLLSLTHNREKAKYGFNGIYTRRLSYDTYIFGGRNTDREAIRNYGIYANMVSMLTMRLDGENLLPFFQAGRLKWFADFTKVDRDVPEARTMSYKPLVSSSEYFSIELTDRARPKLGGIFSSLLNEGKWGAGFDYQMPFNLFSAKQSLKFGYSTYVRNTDYIYSFLRPIRQNDADKEKWFGLPDYAAISKNNLADGTVAYFPLATRGEKDDDSYTGKQTNQAAYAMGDVKWGKLRIIAGVRLELFDMKVNTGLERDSTSGKITKDSISGFKQNAIYPSINLVYGLNTRTNLRFAASVSTARPDFREISPFSYYDFSLPGNVEGNPYLTYTRLYNVDLRYEFFPTPTEVLSATVFYKNFKDPVETLVQPTAGAEFAYINLNQASSTNVGIEVDLRKSLSFIRPSGKIFRNFYITCNGSYLSSQVVVDKAKLYELLKKLNPTVSFDTTQNSVRKRPLQGLSPYSVNAGLLYQGDKFGFNITYNRIGKRLVFLGPESYTDFYENPRDVVDVQVYKKFLKNKVELKLNASDIFRNYFIIYNNSTGATGATKPNDDPKGDNFNEDLDFIIYKAYRGSSFSLSLNYRF